MPTCLARDSHHVDSGSLRDYGFPAAHSIPDFDPQGGVSGQNDFQSRTQLDEPEPLSTLQGLVSLNVADDPPRQHSGDLTSGDLEVSIGQLELVLLVLGPCVR
jgi:hypothetical protein